MWVTKILQIKSLYQSQIKVTASFFRFDLHHLATKITLTGVSCLIQSQNVSVFPHFCFGVFMTKIDASLQMMHNPGYPVSAMSHPVCSVRCAVNSLRNGEPEGRLKTKAIISRLKPTLAADKTCCFRLVLGLYQIIQASIL